MKGIKAIEGMNAMRDDKRRSLVTYCVSTVARHDGTNNAPALKLDAGQFREFIHALKEEDVYRLKHPADFPARP